MMFQLSGVATIVQNNFSFFRITIETCKNFRTYIKNYTIFTYPKKCVFALRCVFTRTEKFFPPLYTEKCGELIKVIYISCNISIIYILRCMLLPFISRMRLLLMLFYSIFKEWKYFLKNFYTPLKSSKSLIVLSEEH